MTSKPPSLPIPNFDDDDAFDTDDHPSHSPYIFSPDEIREDMARYMSDPETSREGDSATSTGSFSMSMSTPNSPSTRANESPTFPPSLQSLELSLSHFSRISLSTPDEEHPPEDSMDHQQPSPLMDGNGYLHTDEVHSPRSDQQEIIIPSPPESPNEIHTPHLTPSASSTPVTEGSEAAPSSSLPSAPAVHSSAIASKNDRPGSNDLIEKPRSHRPHRSMGPSAFEKVRSKTRPVFLPPKPKDEDNKHMADWQQMMRLSRLAGESLYSIRYLNKLNCYSLKSRQASQSSPGTPPSP